ncbi:hypothetical protein U1Q18_021582 [Sarracenia purpurea var. burkii]
MELRIIILLSLCLFWVFIIKLIIILRRSPAKKLPPGPVGLPVIGSLHRLGNRPNHSLAAFAKLYGPLITLKLGSITTIVASSAETAKLILQKHDQTFCDRTVPDVITSQPNPDATIAWAPVDHRWRRLRRICKTRLFNAQTLDLLQNLRHKKARELVLYIGKHADFSAAVDVGRAAFATTLNLMSNTIFSVDMVDPEFESAQEFKDLIWRIMEDSGKANLSDCFPAIKWLDIQGLKRHISTRTRDFLDVLLDECEEDNDSDFNRETIKPVIVDLFIAGSDTSAITTEWAMAELLRNPDSLQKARRELIETIGTKQLVTESDIDRLPYLRSIVKETMRLHPPVPFLLPRRAQHDTELLGFKVPQDAQVLVNAWAIGRDPENWDDPSSFSPERFLDSDCDFRGRNFEFIPFGGGRRICPGMPLAVRIVPLMLASILQSFNWRLPEGITPESLDMEEQFGVTLKKAVPLRAIPVREKGLD